MWLALTQKRSDPEIKISSSIFFLVILFFCLMLYYIAHNSWNTPSGNSFFYLDRVKSSAFWVRTIVGTEFLIVYRQLVIGDQE